MTDCVVVLCTCPDQSEAERIANALVQESLCACVNMVPGLQSIYRWQGNVENAPEILLLAKTTAAKFEALCKRLTELHSYETPEIVALPIVAGSPAYLRWVKEQL